MSGYGANTGGGGGGATTFLGLSDTPGTYTGQSLNAVRVTAGETGLEFFAVPGLDERFAIQFSHDAGVPGAAGVRYLRFGEGVISSQAGFRLPANGQLRGISIQVDATSANTYDVEVLIDPAGRLGAPTVLQTLTLSAGSLFVVNRTFANAVLTTNELGVRIARTAGVGDSAFGAINVLTEWSIP